MAKEDSCNASSTQTVRPRPSRARPAQSSRVGCRRESGLLGVSREPPCLFVVPRPVRASERLDFPTKEWHDLNDHWMVTHDLTAPEVRRVFALEA